MTRKLHSIYHFHEPTDIDVSTLTGKKLLWIFDIDETVLRYDNKKSTFHPFSEEIREWMGKILSDGHALCFLTARYPPKDDLEGEKELFYLLNLSEANDEYYTLHSSVPLFTYTGGELKGPYAKKILNSYLENEDFDAVFFLDDRLTQIEDVLTHCNDLHTSLYGIWISKYSHESKYSSNYNLIRKVRQI